MKSWIFSTLVVSSIATPLAAAELHVATGGDDARSGLTWADALATIGEANARAAGTPGLDTIRVAPGRYVESVTLEPSVTLLGSVDPTTGLSDPDRTPSVLDGGGTGPVVTCAAAADDATLEGFVVTNGRNAANGGGITCAFASPTFRNNRIVGNHCDSDGGGLSAADGSPTIEDNLFLRNTAGDDAGGLRLSRSGAVVRRNYFLANEAVADGGAVRWRDSTAATVLLEDNLFRRNRAGLNGGGVSVVNAIDVLLVGNIYQGNEAGGEGGGLSLRDCPAASVLEELLEGNIAATYGGGVAIRDSAVLRIERTLVRRNGAGQEGGGLRVRLGGPLTLQDAVLARNDAGTGGNGAGGGAALEGLTATLDNVLFFRNTATTGGGLMVDTIPGLPDTPAVVDALAATLQRNEQIGAGATAGAHVGGGSSLTIRDAILFENYGSLDLGGSGTLDVSYSDVEDSTVGVGVFSLDPLFAGPGAVSDAWGVEGSYLSDLGAGQAATSPCIDAGDLTAAALGLDALTTRTDDLADGGTVDLGFHPAPGAGHWAFDVYRSASTRLPGLLYLPGAATGVVDPEAVLADTSRPLLTYRVRGRSILYATKSPDSVMLRF